MTQQKTPRILKIDSSARFAGSTTREMTSRIAARLGGSVTHRDLSDAIPQIDETWVNANWTPADQRTEAQAEALRLSDRLIAEIEAADVLVIGLPLYNFGVPAALKSWIDQVARAGRTFRYTEAGPEGLLTGKRAIVALASGGTPAGSGIDFASGYIRHFLGFIGITEVEIVAADGLMADRDAVLEAANARIEKLAG